MFGFNFSKVTFRTASVRFLVSFGQNRSIKANLQKKSQKPEGDWQERCLFRFLLIFIKINYPLQSTQKQRQVIQIQNLGIGIEYLPF